MNTRLVIGAFVLALLIGTIAHRDSSPLTSEPAVESGLDDHVAPAMETLQPPAIVESRRFNQVEAILKRTATGRHLLHLKETYEVNVQFEEGGGSRFRKRTNLILLDTDRDPIEAAIFFAHEMHHAQVLHEGSQADPKSEARQAYIELKLWEEVAGMMASFQVKMELEQIGIPVAEIRLPLENLFRWAHKVATQQARLSDPRLSEQQLESIGQAAGEQTLYDAFASGNIKTSNTHEPYPSKFGRRWDEAHHVQTVTPVAAGPDRFGNCAFELCATMASGAEDLVSACQMSQLSSRRTAIGGARTLNAVASQPTLFHISVRYGRSPVWSRQHQLVCHRCWLPTRISYGRYDQNDVRACTGRPGG